MIRLMLISLMAMATASHDAGSSAEIALSPAWSESLDEAAEILLLSDAQQRALRRLHEGYAEAYSVRLADAAAELRSARESITLDLTGIAQYFAVWHELATSARPLDERFFGQVRDILTEDQQQRLAIATAARRRDYAVFSSASFPAPNLSMPRLLSEIGIQPDQWEKLMGAIYEAEARMTAAFEEAYQAYHDIYVEDIVPVYQGWMRESEAAGRLLPADALEAATERAEAVHEEVMADLMTLQRHAIERIARALPSRDALRLAHAFAERLYPELSLPLTTEKLLDESAPVALRGVALDRLLSWYAGRAAAVARRMIQLAEQQRLTGEEAGEQQLESLREQVSELQQDAREYLSGERREPADEEASSST